MRHIVNPQISLKLIIEQFKNWRKILKRPEKTKLQGFVWRLFLPA